MSTQTGRMKKANAARYYHAGTLGDMQSDKLPEDERFQCTPRKQHVHRWLFGTDNAVCSMCGKTVPKHALKD